MPARSPRAASVGRWSSATRLRSSTTTTASCWITPANAATPPTHHNSPPLSAESSAAPGRHPRTVTADRGYGEARVENDLHELGVRTVVIPRKGRPGKARQAHEHRRARVPPHRQVGAPAAKHGSAPSNASTAGIAPALTGSTEPGPGPDTESSPTTWSRSPPSPPDHRRAASTTPIRTRITDVQTGTHRVLQVEVAIPDWHGCANRSRCTWWG
jgi:hypothetical protein